MTVNPCYLSAHAGCGKVEPQNITGAWQSISGDKGKLNVVRCKPKRPLNCEVVKWYNAGLISQSPQFDSEPTQQTLSTGPFTNLNAEGERYIPPFKRLREDCEHGIVIDDLVI